MPQVGTPRSSARSKLTSEHDLRELGEDVAQAYQEQRDAIKLRAMVLGPNIDDGEGTASVQLRRVILERSPHSGIILSVRPEEPELIRVAKKELGANYDLCRFELQLARVCDLIVLVPDSPGSFAEFGLFALNTNACSKMLVLLDRQYRGGDSYLMHGPRRASHQRGATIKYVDYADAERAWRCVLEFATSIRDLIMDENLMGFGE